MRAETGDTMEPLLVAKIDDALYVVDGFHRLEAAQRAGLATMQGRVKVMNLRRAVQLSRLVNIGNRALALTSGQRSEAAWQHVLDITRGGKRTLREAGTTQDEVKDAFGISKRQTIGSMVKQGEFAAELRKRRKSPEDVSRKTKYHLADDELDPYSKYPTWRAVCRRLSPGYDPNAEADGNAVHIKLVTKMAAWVAQYGEDAVRDAYRSAVNDEVYGDESEEEPEGAADF
jgi:hypothetical protein